LTDAEIAEVRRSKDVFDEVRAMTAPLDAILSLIHALDWLDLKSRGDKIAVQAFFTSQFGDPVEIALGKEEIASGAPEALRLAEIFARARELIAEEKFLNWQVLFPGVWSNWDSAELRGGFDAVIGNPPWDWMKLQQVEWFAARRRKIALAQRASDRQRMIAALEKKKDPLAQDFWQGQCAGRSRRALGPQLQRLPASVWRRPQHLFALCRAGDGARKAKAHGWASDPFRHRLRQNRRALFQGRGGGRAAEGAL
jgi:hypothetical protein